MKITTFRARNFRSFSDTGIVELDSINLFVGANNSGKSSILRALHHMQTGLNDIFADVRVGETESQIEINVEIKTPQTRWGAHLEAGTANFSCSIKSNDRRGGSTHMRLSSDGGVNSGDLRIPDSDPHHFIVPFFSKRKPIRYNEDIREQFVTQISSDMNTLSAKLSRLTNPNFPEYGVYAAACKAILGFVVTTIPSPSGQMPGIYLKDRSTIPIDQMGEGVPNIVYLLTQLAASKNKLFLIEEPENDLHPQALKALLNLIIESSEENQFVISTHSNIVVSHLCSIAKSKLFKIFSEKENLPTLATIEVIPTTAEARVQVLQELGYAFSDYDLWDGWLLLEEASAERIIRDYLVPWFIPKLARVKTVSASGVSNVEPAFVDLHRLMLFTHLQPAYAGRAWIRVDGDAPGAELVNKLRKRFPTIASDHFSTFDQPQFERYYPKEFEERAEEVLSIADRLTKRDAKKQLLTDVIAWLDEDPERAKKALAESAASVIEDLQRIELQLDALK